MGKGAKAAELSNSGNAQSRSSNLYNQSQDLYGGLSSQLQQEASNPQGYTPQQLAYMNTASQQSLGGGTAATTGQANLEAARSKNVGGFQGAIGSANRSNQRQLSTNALGIQQSQANLQQAQRQQALQSLQSLYGTNLQGSEGYLNTSNTALSNENTAPNFWQQYLLQGEQAAAKAGATAGG